MESLYVQRNLKHLLSALRIRANSCKNVFIMEKINKEKLKEIEEEVLSGSDFLKKLLSVIVLILLLVGCNHEPSFSEFSFSEINLKNANKDVQAFIEELENYNGTHLYFERDSTIYIFLNGKNELKDGKKVYFSNFNVDVKEKTLNIYYNQKETDDNLEITANDQLLYQINLDKKYEVIKAFGNGELKFSGRQ